MFTHLYWLYLRVENQIDLKRFEISSEQIVQCDTQYDVNNTYLKFMDGQRTHGPQRFTIMESLANQVANDLDSE